MQHKWCVFLHTVPAANHFPLLLSMTLGDKVRLSNFYMSNPKFIWSFTH